MKNEKYSDEMIIEKVLHGDIDFFKVIVLKYQKYIFNIGMGFYKNQEDAYDFVQEIFTKVFNKLNTFKGRSKFSTWLIKIAYNHGVNSIKKNILDVSLIDPLISDGDLSPEWNYLREEVKAALKMAIKELPERYRICIDLYFFYGISYGEIREITGFEMNTIKSNVFRAKQILRKALQGTIAEEYYELQ